MAAANSQLQAAIIYVSTSGNDNTADGTFKRPFKTIGRGISVLASGDTLVVGKGTYVGKPNFITGLPAGTRDAMTQIRAESPMEVRIRNGGKLDYNERMLNLNRDYLHVDGFIFDMSGTPYPPNIGSVSGSFNKLTRSIFRREGNVDEYGGLLIVSGSDNLFEDLAGTGACRYCFSQGGPTAMTQRNIWRRVVGRFDYTNSRQPKATFATYGNDSIEKNAVFDHLYQNVIAIDGQYPGTLGGDEKYGAIYVIKAATRVRLQGCIVLNEGVAYSGLHLRDYKTGSINSVENSVVWDLRGSRTLAIGIKAHNAERVTVGGVIPAKPLNLDTSNAPSSLLKPANPPLNLLTNNPGATVTKRYGVSGTRWGEPGYDQLTNEDLWPWPYQDKIKEVFAEENPVPHGNQPLTNLTTRGFASRGVGYYGGPITLTSYIWEYLGNVCPSKFCPH